MTTDEFAQRLQALTAEDIERVAAALRADRDTADGEVAWWRATIAVTGALRRSRSGRQASLAAHRAVNAVLDAARVAGIDGTHRDDVTAVARAAADAVRGLVATDVPDSAREPLLHPWLQVA